MTNFVGKEYTKRSSRATPNCGAIHGLISQLHDSMASSYGLLFAAHNNPMTMLKRYDRFQTC